MPGDADATARSVQVLIAGAGPTGLMLACELGLAGVRTLVLERLPKRRPVSWAFNLNTRSLEILDRRGIVARFLAEGPALRDTFFGGPRLDLSCLDSSHAYTLGISQTRTEELLEARATEVGAIIRRGHEVTGFAQDAGVTVNVLGPDGRYDVRADYLVGCDGAGSVVRECAGIGFPGTTDPQRILMGDVELAEPGSLPVGLTRTDTGSVRLIPRPNYVRVVVGEAAAPPDPDTRVTLEELQAAVSHVVGRDINFANPQWLTRFDSAARQADRYRCGRVLLAGDAAHIQPPGGAQGLNVGIQDASNLGWKLAAEVHGWAPDGLLDTYQAERHPVGASTLRNARALAALSDPAERVDPLRELFAELIRFEPVNRYLAELATGVATRYDLGMASSHELLGAMVPDFPLETGAQEQTTVSRLLYSGRPVLLDLEGCNQCRAVAAGWKDRVDSVTARPAQAMDDLAALLIRPDGYAVWVAPENSSDRPAGLAQALSRWFGPALSG